MTEDMIVKSKKVLKNRVNEKPSKIIKQEKSTSEKVQVDSALANGAKLETLTSELEPKVAKAGKRSTKAIKETEEKIAKEERKTKSNSEATEAESKPKHLAKSARSRLERRSKNYRLIAQQIDKTLDYEFTKAVQILKSNNKVKFDPSLEVHIKLGVDPRQADQNIRQTVVLPAGNGKSSRVAVFAEADQLTKLKQAGADLAAADELLEQLEAGKLDFDILITSPKLMPKLSKYARLLGPKGLMPNPKSGTVSADLEKAVTEAKSGKIEYRVDSEGIIHVAIGKLSFPVQDLSSNFQALMQSVRTAKPINLKGNYILSLHLAATMSPSLKISHS